jgi:cytochrome c553
MIELLLLLSVAPPVDFARDIAPVLTRCQACHGAQQALSGLRLDSREALVKGGSTGPAIKPGASAESNLIAMVSGQNQKKIVMPPAGERLKPEQIAALKAWIDQGAVWPEKPVHWAFVTPKRPALPEVRNAAGIRNPIDRFILAKLENDGLAPSPEAPRRTLIRRLSFDLTGLPPTPDEVAAFVNDARPDAYQRQVDRLLALPHYGEKWARFWLDLGRYADSDGYEKDTVRPHAWRYRQWLIDALNRDLPFDQFTLETMAGDILPDAKVDQKIATGFHRNTLTNREGGVNPEQFRFEQVLDRANTLGTVWLGLTFQCAQCHDHKYDPITQKDAYALQAFFNSADETLIDAPMPGETGPRFQALPAYLEKKSALLAEYKIPDLQAAWEQRLLVAAGDPGKSHEWDFAMGVLRVMVDKADEMLKLGVTGRTARQNEIMTDHFLAWYNSVVSKERLKDLKIDEVKKKIAELEAALPPLAQAPVIQELREPRQSHVASRGDYREKGIEVRPDTPGFLPPLQANGKASRIELARWLVSAENPLTTRVTMNRMWQEFFGRGIVRTSEDFGRMGERPTHPELLDWLAVEFRESGWSMKRMHKLIVESAVYRQSSAMRPALQTTDPANTLLARQSRLRLPAEAVRDAALASSGLLYPAIGGKSVRPPQPEGVAALGYGNGVKWNESQGPERYRRGLYIHFQRTTPYPLLMTFDSPDSNLTCSRRQRTNTPLQALNLLNDPVFFEAAQALAARIVREKPDAGLTERIDYGFLLCVGRPASGREKDLAAGFYRKQKQILERDPQSAQKLFPVPVEGAGTLEAATWVGVARTLLNLDEFITRE